MDIIDTEKIFDSLDESIIQKGMLKDYGNGILLSDDHIEVLKRYDIDYKNYNNLSSLIYQIEDCLNDSYSLDVDDLEWVATDLSERNYYHNTNK